MIWSQIDCVAGKVGQFINAPRIIPRFFYWMCKMRVLIACEYSGRVREAFRKLGHDAWSCDILPSDTPSLFHYQGDVFDIIGGGGT